MGMGDRSPFLDELCPNCRCRWTPNHRGPERPRPPRHAASPRTHSSRFRLDRLRPRPFTSLRWHQMEAVVGRRPLVAPAGREPTRSPPCAHLPRCRPCPTMPSTTAFTSTPSDLSAAACARCTWPPLPLSSFLIPPYSRKLPLPSD